VSVLWPTINREFDIMNCVTTIRSILAVAILVTGAAATAAAENDALVETKMMKPETALKLAQAALQNCRDAGAQVAVSVVDRSGVTQVILRDRYAGPHTPETARRKAWTAISFRGDTLSLSEAAAPGGPAYGANFITGALMLGGGVPVDAGGVLVGAVGVSGAPSGRLDDQCARAGIEAVADDLMF
jgi:uncharacterized protein GlcG (DUF336 family)